MQPLPNINNINGQSKTYPLANMRQKPFAQLRKGIQILKTYDLDSTKITIGYDEKSGVFAYVSKIGQVTSYISKEWISGIPKVILNDSLKVTHFLNNTYAKLNRLSGGGYHLYVNHRLQGGGKWGVLCLSAAAVGIGIAYKAYHSYYLN